MPSMQVSPHGGAIRSVAIAGSDQGSDNGMLSGADIRVRPQGQSKEYSEPRICDRPASDAARY